MILIQKKILALALSASVLAWLGITACKPVSNPKPAQTSLEPAKASPAASPAASQRIREPAVAGLFYPKEEAELSQTLDALLAQEKPQTMKGELRALISPHAGYPFSGPVAAFAYRLLKGRQYETVVVLGPSHYALFQGASIVNADAYRTPLGLTPISPKAAAWAKTSPFVLEPQCRVQQPQWSLQVSRPESSLDGDTPETWEHSVEVQVPFLQKTLQKFSLVSIITGQVDPRQIATALADKLDDRTLVVASTDLSHFHPYDEARARDAATVQAMVDVDDERMQQIGDACGITPVLALLHLARLKGWKPVLLDCRNSGDTAGNKESVVGYAALAFFSQESEGFSKEERKQLITLVRQTLQDKLAHKSGPEPDISSLPARFQEAKGCFVTLTENGLLRGCIGHILPQEALYKAIRDNAENAAFRDPRFLPVKPDELDKIEIEISVLTVPEALPFTSPEDLMAKLHPHVDGVVLQINGHNATYLPQVWDQIPDKEEFLNNLAQKAGCAPGDWRNPGTQVFIYHVEAFKESEL